MSDALHFEAMADVDRPLVTLLAPHLRAHVGLLALGTLAAIASPVATLLPIYLVETVIDEVLLAEAAGVPFVPDAWAPAGGSGRILTVAGMIVLLASVGAVTAWLGTWCWGRIAQAIQHDIRTETFGALQALDLAFFESEQTGQLVSVLNDDVNQLNRLLERSLAQSIEIAARFLAITVLLFAMHWQLALVMTVLIPLLALTARAFVRRLAPKHRQVRQLVGALSARLHNTISGITTVKAYTREPIEAEMVAAASGALRAGRWSVIRTRAKFYPTMSLIQWSGFAGVLALGGTWILHGPPLAFTRPLRVGTLVSFLLLGQQFTTPLVQGAQLVDDWHDGRASAYRIAALRTHVGSPTSEPDADAAIAGRIAFDAVRFGYPGSDEPALRGVSFTVEPGEFVGIVGPTGSGKTTIAKLLLQFYAPDRGEIRIGGRDTRNVSDERVRSSIGVVLQDPGIFSGTVAENIRYGRPDADAAALARAAERANLGEFVDDRPEQFEHVLEEGGSNLSGGQRQRLALARAFVSDRPILLLDEATSHVDMETEAALREAIADSKRTTIAIAHRLSVIRHADRILVLEDGEIVERGTHDALLEHDRTYAQLWRLQTGSEPRSQAPA